MDKPLMKTARPDAERDALLARGLVMMLLMASLLQMFSIDPTQVEQEVIAIENEPVQMHATAPSTSVNDYDVGGRHLLTNDWWEGLNDAIPSIGDPDGDGIDTTNDSDPWDRNIGPESTRCSSGCVHRNELQPSDEIEYLDDISIQVSQIGDIDMDGDLDIVVISSGWIKYILNEKGTFGDPVSIGASTSSATKMIDLLDFDLDGDLDIISGGLKSVRIFQMDGTTLVSTNQIVDCYAESCTEKNFRSIDFGDVNNDGYPDILVAAHTSAGDAVRLFQNPGNGSIFFSQVWEYTTSMTATYGSTFLDYDSDGDADIAFSTWDGSNCASAPSCYPVYIFNVDSSRADLVNSSHDILLERSYVPNSIESADLNKDGHDELIVGDTSGDFHVYWNLHSTTGSAGIGQPEVGDNYTTALDVGTSDFYTQEMFNLVDINGDGLLDFLLGSHSSAYEVGIALATGLETIGGQIEYEVAWTTYAHSRTFLLAGDIDGNGIKDIFLSSRDTTLSFQRFGGTTAKTTVEHGFDAISGSNYGTGGGLIVDMDADGDNDILLAGQQEISVYENSNGLSEDSVTELEQFYGTDMAVGDINGDGYLDLVTTGYEYMLQLRWGSADGYNSTEDEQIIPELGKRLGAVSIKDVNGDGKLDIAMDSMRGSQGTLRGYVYTYDGDGGFDQYWKSEERNSTTGYAINAVIADIDGDGLQDYIRCATYKTLLYSGTSTGSGDGTRYNFSSTSIEIATDASFSRDCDVADLNNDGNMDLLVVHSPSLRVYEGPVSSSTSSIANSISTLERIDITDFDLDGLPDIMASTRGSDKSRVVTYSEGSLHTLWEGGNYRLTRGMLHGDLNGDDIPDLVLLNFANIPDLILGEKDLDLDGVPDSTDDFLTNPTQGGDYDSDGFGDSSTGFQTDACPYYWGDSTEDRRGCPDQDGDGWSDLNDAFWRDGNQWNDTDSDGYGDNHPASATRESHWPGVQCPNAMLPCNYDPEPLDWDDDGYEDATLSTKGAIAPYDSCPFEAGFSFNGTKYGCLDSDMDGWANVEDAFPMENTQYIDSDGDGFGDSITGWLPDKCPNNAGTSYVDFFGCLDNDGDGVSYLTDIDDNDMSEQDDTDNDTVGDNGDFCPYQWSNLTGGPDRGCPDTDGDGRADRSDEFPYDYTQWLDVDGDGYGDNPDGNNADEFPADETQWKDSDGDGRGDQPGGGNSDAFPYDETQWQDTDGDGYGNNQSGNYSDACPTQPGTSQYRLHHDGQKTDRLGCPDSDNDYIPDDNDECTTTAGTSFIDRIGCADNDGDNISDMNDPYPWEYSSGADSGDWDNDSVEDFRPGFQLTGADVFPDDSTQFEDVDGDGYGDNTSGNNGDYCPNTPQGQSVNDRGCAESELDDDNDGITNNLDECPESDIDDPVDAKGCLDEDEDGVGDSEDAFPHDGTQTTDLDGDGYGDSKTGTNADDCPSIAGTSWRDKLGCVDSDGDGYSDQGDMCANLPGWSSAPHQGCPDRDNDGVADVVDTFPDDANETRDSDGDGYGDNNDTCFSIVANATVDCIFDKDNDGFNDTTDVFPEDGSEWKDSDGDGYGDNSDVWPTQSEIWSDGDGDGWADQFGHILTDDCPSIPGGSSKFMMGCSDIDNDGMPDLLDPDIDGDGITNDNEMDASTSMIEYDPFDANSTPPDMDGDSIPDSMDKDTDGDGFPNDMEEERGSASDDANKTPFNIYGNQDTGLFYVPGEGFKSQYDPNGMEISVSMILDMITSEFLVPILILPITLFALLAKGRRYKKVKKRLEACTDMDVLKEYEKDIDELIMKKKVKVEHGMLLRNLFERIKEEMENTKAIPSTSSASRGGGGPGRPGGPGRGRPTPVPKERKW